MAHWLHAAAALGLTVLLAGCASPPPPPPTTVALTLTATADVNPTPSGQGAPVVIRVYQLGSAAGFTGAEFFDLFNNDQATLKADLIKREDVVLAPGQTRTMTLLPSDQVKAIGIFAGWRDYQNAVWRGSADVAPHKTTKVTVLANHAGITVSAPAATPAAAGSPPAASPPPAAAPAAAVPSMPALPSTPSLPGMPALPSLPAAPSLPSMPAVPSIPSLPGT